MSRWSPAVSKLAICLVIVAFTSGENTSAVSAKSVSSPLPKGFDKLIDGAGSDMKGGNYPKAETKLKTALEMLSKSKDTDDKLLTAEILSDMCLCQMSDLRYLEALKSAPRSFEIYKQLPGQRGPRLHAHELHARAGASAGHANARAHRDRCRL